MRKQVHTICGDFDKERYENLTAAYRKALDDRIPIFNFEGEPMITDFAEGLVRLLDPQFKVLAEE